MKTLRFLCLLPLSIVAAPLPPVLDARQIEERCDRALVEARAEVTRMEKRKGGDVFAEWNRLQIGVEDIAWPGALFGMVHTDKAARDAGDACYARSLELDTEMLQSAPLFRRVREAQADNPRRARLKQDLLDRFEDAGVALPSAKRARVKEIRAALESLRQRFFRNVGENKASIALAAEEMRGLDESFLARLKRDDAGRYLLPVIESQYGAFMRAAANGAARQRAMTAWFRTGGEANMALLDEIVGLRRELAGLLGARSFADLQIRRKMAGSPEAVSVFLDRVHGAIATQEKVEIEQIRAAKAKDLGTPAEETPVVRPDIPYYLPKVRDQQFGTDPPRVSIPTAKAIAYVQEVAERLYGLEFRPLEGPVWHADVICKEAIDKQTHEIVGAFCLDLFARDGKYTGDSAIHVFGASRVAGRRPFSVLVANVGRTSVGLYGLESVMHEFGHVMHGVLSDTDYVMHSGTRVMGDFVEAPSQIFEAWASDTGALALLRQKCPECTGLDPASLERHREVQRFGRGISYSIQWMISVYDMRLASGDEKAVESWNRLQAEVALGDGAGSLRPAGSRHIAGGYAAGLYGYLWSKAIADDLLSAFRGNLLDPAVGRRFRGLVLSQGGQKHPNELVREFLEREPSSDAFFSGIR